MFPQSQKIYSTNIDYVELGTPSHISTLCVMTRERQVRLLCTLLGVPSCVRFCQQEFGEFPRLVGQDHCIDLDLFIQ